MMAKRTPKDQAVRDRIITDLDTSFAVEAGAGTGKTALLTARMIDAVRTGRAKLTEIVAITFTERAANELRARVRDELQKLFATSTGDEAARLSEALAAVDFAHISTIHSFASEILRERPVEAGVDPGFGIAEGLTAGLLFDEVWARWLRKQLAGEGGPLRSAFLAGLSAEHLKEFARFLIDNPGLEPSGCEVDAGPALEKFTGEFVGRARRLHAWMQKECPSPDCTCCKRCAIAAEAVAGIEDIPPDEQMVRAVSLQKLVTTRPQKACKDKEQREKCKAELAELGRIAIDLAGPAAHAVVVKAAGVLQEMAEAYVSAKLDRALLDFDDLLLKARDLLRGDKVVRGYFQARFKMILVDECQDTDPRQTEIVFFLAEDGPKAAGWRDVRIVPGKLLFVGDPKQSIYRFRRADIETYEEAKQIVAQSGELLEISQNFRSSASCVQWFNAVFAELIQRPDDGAYQPAYIALDAWRPDAGPAVTALKPPEGATFGTIDAARAAEAHAVTAEIKAMVERGDTVLDRETREPRPMTYGDVALLFRARTGFEIYERALGGAGVPFRAVSGRGFFAKQEVLELRVVLAAVERPFDEVAVVAALRTSLLGVSDDELAEAASGGFNYLAGERKTGTGTSGASEASVDAACPVFPSHIDGAFRLLRDWHEARSSGSMSGLVQSVLGQTKALELFYLKPGGEQRAANLTKVIDAARAFEQTAGATFGGFVRWLDEMSTAAEEEESPLAGDDGTFVKLLTIHKAKGLEFPVVVLSDIAGSSSHGAKRVVNRQEATYDVQLGSGELGVETMGFADAAEYEAVRDEAEARRILYVAATRARDRLVVPHFPRQGKPAGYLAYLTGLGDDAAAAAGEVETEVIAELGEIGTSEPRAFRIHVPKKRPKEYAKLIAERSEWTAKRDALIEERSKEPKLKTASALHGDDHADFGAEPSDGETGRAVGSAVHAVLEHADLLAGSDLAVLAEEEAAREGIPGHRALVEELARNALNTDLVKRAVKAATLYREVPFAVDVVGTILEGVIDLAFDDGSGLEIVDYKTDDVAEKHLAEHARAYRLQVGAYALAVEKVFGRRPSSASLLFLRHKREECVPIDDALLAAVKKEL